MWLREKVAVQEIDLGFLFPNANTHFQAVCLWRFMIYGVCGHDVHDAVGLHVRRHFKNAADAAADRWTDHRAADTTPAHGTLAQF